MQPQLFLLMNVAKINIYVWMWSRQCLWICPWLMVINLSSRSFPSLFIYLLTVAIFEGKLSYFWFRKVLVGRYLQVHIVLLPRRPVLMFTVVRTSDLVEENTVLLWISYFLILDIHEMYNYQLEVMYEPRLSKHTWALYLTFYLEPQSAKVTT